MVRGEGEGRVRKEMERDKGERGWQVGERVREGKMRVKVRVREEDGRRVERG